MIRGIEIQFGSHGILQGFKNLKVKRCSLSDTIEVGMPCNLTISLIYRLAKLSKLARTLQGRKWAVLVNLLTMTQIASCPAYVLGIPTTKSIMIWYHFPSDTSRFCRVPAGLWCFALTCLNVMHLLTCCHALAHMLSYLLHFVPPIVLLEIIAHLRTIGVDYIPRVMHLILNLSSIIGCAVHKAFLYRLGQH